MPSHEVAFRNEPSDVEDDFEIGSDHDDGPATRDDHDDVEAAFTTGPGKPATRTAPHRPLTASATAGRGGTREAAASANKAAADEPRGTATTTQPLRPRSAGYDLYRAAALRQRQPGHLSSTHIEELSAMLRGAITKPRMSSVGAGTHVDATLAAHPPPLPRNRPASATVKSGARPEAVATDASGRPWSAAATSAAHDRHPSNAVAGGGTAAIRAARRSRPQTATSKSRPSTAAVEPTATPAWRPASASGRSAFDLIRPSEDYVALENRYFADIESMKQQSLRRTQITAASLFPQRRSDPDEAYEDREVDATDDAAAMRDMLPAGGISRAPTRTGGGSGRPPSGARTRPQTAAAGRPPTAAAAWGLDSGAQHSARSGVSSAASLRPASAVTAKSAGSRSAAPMMNLDPAVTLGTAQTLPVRFYDEDRLLRRAPSTNVGKKAERSDAFFGNFEHQDISAYLNAMKLRRHAPYRVAAQRSAGTRRAHAAQNARMRADASAAIEYIQDYVATLGPLHLDP
jgi:hypothetical protein